MLYVKVSIKQDKINALYQCVAIRKFENKYCKLGVTVPLFLKQVNISTRNVSI